MLRGLTLALEHGQGRGAEFGTYERIFVARPDTILATDLDLAYYNNRNKDAVYNSVLEGICPPAFCPDNIKVPTLVY